MTICEIVLTSDDRLHVRSKNSDLVVERIRHLPVGGRMKDIPEHLWHDSYLRVGEKNTGGPNLRLLRLDPSLPSNTVTAYIFNKFAHPIEDRYVTPREAARLQQFPDSHLFSGSIVSVQLQIGNAVPSGLAAAVAELAEAVAEEADAIADVSELPADVAADAALVAALAALVAAAVAEPRMLST